MDMEHFREESDLQKVIVELREWIRLVEELREKGVEDIPLSRYAHNLLRYTMFLRIAENDPSAWILRKTFRRYCP